MGDRICKRKAPAIPIYRRKLENTGEFPVFPAKFFFHSLSQTCFFFYSIQENTSEKTIPEKEDEEPAPCRQIVEEKKEQIDQERYAAVLKQLFIERRGRGLYPSAKDLQEI
jgi:hypothetical protein